MNNARCNYRYCSLACPHVYECLNRLRLRTYQTGGKDNVAPDQCLGFFHLFEQFRITDDSRRIPDLSARLVEPGDAADNGSFGDIGKVGDLLERLFVSPACLWWLFAGIKQRPPLSMIAQSRGAIRTIPLAHSYTTSTKPGLNFSLNASCCTEHAICCSSTLSAIE